MISGYGFSKARDMQRHRGSIEGGASTPSNRPLEQPVSLILEGSIFPDRELLSMETMVILAQ